MRSASLMTLLMLSLLTLPGCELAGDIFKAGIWTGLIAVLLVIAIIGFVISKVGG